MKKHILVCLAALACTALLASAPVRAQSEASVALSLLPVASVWAPLPWVPLLQVRWWPCRQPCR